MNKKPPCVECKNHITGTNMCYHQKKSLFKSPITGERTQIINNPICTRFRRLFCHFEQRVIDDE